MSGVKKSIAKNQLQSKKGSLRGVVETQADENLNQKESAEKEESNYYQQRNDYTAIRQISEKQEISSLGHDRDLRTLLSSESSSILHSFKIDHDLKQNFSLDLQQITEQNVIKTDNGRWYSLDNLEPVEVFTSNASYVIDGQNVSLSFLDEGLSFSRTDGAETVLVTKDAKGLYETIDIINEDGSDFYMAKVVPGVMATIPPKAFDQNSLNKKVLFDIDTAEIDRNDINYESYDDFQHFDENIDYENAGSNERSLDDPPDYYKESNQNGSRKKRSLQAGCSSFKIIQVAIAFDSTFCQRHGGEANSRNVVRNIVSRASILYQQQGVCTRIMINRLEGYCNANQDPYRQGVRLNNIGCSGGGGLISFFRNYWINNRQSVQRDSAHLFYHSGTRSSVVGCANTNSLCQKQSVGVNDMSFTNDLQRMTALFAHELGHNVGLSHVISPNNQNYIMDSIGFGSHTWSTQSRNRLGSLIKSKSCTSTIDGQMGFRIKSGANNLCLTVPNKKATNGAMLKMMPCNNKTRGNSQRWITDGRGLIHSSLDYNKCLVPQRSSTKNGSVIQLSQCAQTNNKMQTWKFQNKKLMSKENNKKCISGNDQGQKAFIWNCKSNDKAQELKKQY